MENNSMKYQFILSAGQKLIVAGQKLKGAWSRQRFHLWIRDVVNSKSVNGEEECIYVRRSGKQRHHSDKQSNLTAVYPSATDGLQRNAHWTDVGSKGTISDSNMRDHT